MLYKYKKIDDLMYFLDIVLNERLYAALYSELNDPMEGQYLYTVGAVAEQTLDKIYSEKQDIRILSLTRNKNNKLMWSHYADGHKGVAIGIEIDAELYDIRDIDYIETMVRVTDDDLLNSREKALSILSSKHNIWSYEEEVRVFSQRSKFINVKIKEVILGSEMEDTDREVISTLISKLFDDVDIINNVNVIY